jgi:hypothetical protein
VAGRVQLQIQFYDLDPMEIVWHGRYVEYMETARCALLDQIGYNYPAMKDSGYGWPVIDLRLRYAPGPLRAAHQVAAAIVRMGKPPLHRLPGQRCRQRYPTHTRLHRPGGGADVQPRDVLRIAAGTVAQARPDSLLHHDLQASFHCRVAAGGYPLRPLVWRGTGAADPGLPWPSRP